MTKFVVIEGIDGTGKKTQYDLLIDYIKNNLKKPVLELDFPQYGQTSAKYVERYLNGKYGTNVHPDLASMLYAFDRWQAKSKIDNFIKNNPEGLIISNRYVISNLAHQGGKIKDETERLEFYEEQMKLEFELFQIPKPDINFVMLLPEKIAQENVDKKAKREYTEQKRDIHEADLDHLKNAASAYLEICEQYKQFASPINCWDPTADKMLSINEIHTNLVDAISSHL